MYRTSTGRQVDKTPEGATDVWDVAFPSQGMASWRCGHRRWLSLSKIPNVKLPWKYWLSTRGLTTGWRTSKQPLSDLWYLSNMKNAKRKCCKSFSVGFSVTWDRYVFQPLQTLQQNLLHRLGCRIATWCCFGCPKHNIYIYIYYIIILSWWYVKWMIMVQQPSSLQLNIW